ncbi:MAG: hypothetical protein AAGU76_17380 [Sedimentibacter sp.]|uniref:hypothetical protein n=1 Tax=Sedimentibacter sp. TaxID=1960295 RepID=UPI003157F4DE
MKKSKKVLIIFLTLLMITVPAFGAKGESVRVPDELLEEDVAPATTCVGYLRAGQNDYEDIGKIYIETVQENEEGSIFRITVLLRPEFPDWSIQELNVEAINDDADGYPGDLDFISSNGGLIPGKFSVKKEFEEPVRGYSFLYYSSCANGRDVIGFAVHLVVVNGELNETAWSDCWNSDPYDGANWSEIMWRPLMSIEEYLDTLK